MTKKQFLKRLKRELKGLPKQEIETSLRFYDEAICERMEHGFTEAEAVAAVGSPDVAAAGILAELPEEAVNRMMARRRFLRIISIPALILGSPIWLTLLLTAAVVLITLAAIYISVVASLFSCTLAFAVSVLAALYHVTLAGSIGNGLVYISAAMAFCGLAIFCALGTVAMAKAGIRGVRNIFRARRGKAVDV